MCIPFAGYRVTATFGIVTRTDSGSVSTLEMDKIVNRDRDVAATKALLVQTSPPGDRSSDEGSYATILARVLRTIEQRPLPEASSFGILLSHKYTRTAVAVEHLKGADKVLHAALLRAGYSLSFRPVVYRNYVQVQ
jgi:hypothetical protein